MAQTDDDFDRLMKLLDVGLEALKTGDGDGTIMALQVATDVADKMPKKAQSAICLPGPTEGGNA